jgi:heme exporter protein A
MSFALELRDLACVRGERPLFSGVKAAVQRGQLLRVNGTNGAGKTSLLRLICGLGQPEQGEVLWHGRSVPALREELHREMVYLGHVAALKDNVCAVENLVSAHTLAGGECDEHDALAALHAAGLAGCEWLPVRMLSQGQRKRAALARLSLCGSAALWVLDEPFNTLDADATAWLTGLIAVHLARGGVVVLTSHQPVPFDASVAQVVVSL